MMKVLTMHYTVKRGGAYDRFKMMLEALLEGGCEVHCLSLTPIRIGNSHYHNHLLFHPSKRRDGLATKSWVLFAFPLYSFLVGWRKRIDLFVAFGSLYAFIQAIPKLLLRRPAVTFIRGNFAYGLSSQKSSILFSWLYPLIEKIGVLASDRIIVNNLALKEEMFRIASHRRSVGIDVLFNNIPPIPQMTPLEISQKRRQLDIPQEAKVLITAGVLNRGKNIEVVLQSLPKTDVKDLFLLIAGESFTKEDLKYKNYLQELSRALGLDEKKILFTGWLEKPKLWQLLYCSNLFILASKNEGMPNILLEALGCDLPCFGSNVAGIRDILRDDLLMFNPFDSETLARKVQSFFHEPTFYTKVAKLCVDRKQEFVFDWKQKAFEMIARTPKRC
jgi:glycosyltransferase involved in cell wall biosynthesis